MLSLVVGFLIVMILIFICHSFNNQNASIESFVQSPPRSHVQGENKKPSNTPPPSEPKARKKVSFDPAPYIF